MWTIDDCITTCKGKDSISAPPARVCLLSLQVRTALCMRRIHVGLEESVKVSSQEDNSIADDEGSDTSRMQLIISMLFIKLSRCGKGGMRQKQRNASTSKS